MTKQICAFHKLVIDFKRLTSGLARSCRFLATILPTSFGPMAMAMATATAIALVTSISNKAQAYENLGTLEVSDVLLLPTYTYKESNRGSFSLGSSYFAVSWTRDRVVSATLKVGSKELLGSPIRYGSGSSVDQAALIEAYAQAVSDIGRFRFGVIPIPFGLEGGDAERRLNFPRSLFYQSRYLAIRDYGISYHISNDGFFSDWSLSNGEGGVDLDSEIWFSSRLGWQGGRFIRLGASGVAGRTSPKSTNPLGTSKSSDAGLDVDKAARIRVVNFYLDWQTKPIRFSFESSAGDTTQESNVIKARAGHADFELELNERASWLVRYDVIDPRNDLGNDQITEYSTGFSFRGKYENSVFYVLGTKKVQQDVSADEHRGLIMWRLTPSGSSLPSSL